MLLKVKGPSYFLRIFSYKMWRGKGIHQGQFVALKIRGCRIAYWGCRKVSNIEGSQSKYTSTLQIFTFYYMLCFPNVEGAHAPTVDRVCTICWTN